MSPFQPKWDTFVLLMVMHAVARQARPDAPELVSQREYDAARSAAGYPASPRAYRLAERYGMTWHALRKQALATDNPLWSVATRGANNLSVLTTEEAYLALRAAAARLGQDNLTPADYEHARLLINADLDRLHVHGQPAKRLPGLSSLQQKWSFHQLAVDAGLTPGKMGQRDMPPTVWRDEAVQLFLRHCGFVPGREHLAWFMRTHRISMTTNSRMPQAEAVARAVARMAAQGHWVPQRPAGVRAPENWKETASISTRELREAHRRAPSHPARYTVADARASVERAFAQIAPGEKLTSRAYEVLCGRDASLMSSTSVARATKAHGLSFGKLVQEVAQARAQALSQAPKPPIATKDPQ